jgi:hypothetical protein
MAVRALQSPDLLPDDSLAASLSLSFHEKKAPGTPPGEPSGPAPAPGLRIRENRGGRKRDLSSPEPDRYVIYMVYAYIYAYLYLHLDVIYSQEQRE